MVPRSGIGADIYVYLIIMPAAGCPDFPAFIGADIFDLFYVPSSKHVFATTGERETATAGCTVLFCFVFFA